VLGDPAKRMKYDEQGANWQQATATGGSQGWVDEYRSYHGAGPGGGSYEFHFGGTGFSDFFEQYFGG
jgi:curved DNA-binding protein